jgi:EAL domain-containing protein (putative c-di-GMP-specific phosphodiesterase class I)
MNCAVIAEGIETETQRELLLDIGVDCGQGYLFARPQAIAPLIAALEKRNPAVELKVAAET